MASFRVFVAILAGLALATVPAKADNNDVFNFAINLECLESQFYQYAAYGEYRNASLLAGGPPATGGKKASLSAGVQTIAAEFARDETAHLAFLRSAAGAAAVPCPQIDIVNSFPAVIKAALGSRAGNYNFSPYDNDVNFLLSAFLFEDVGATAFAGAIPVLVGADAQSAANGIGGVEAYHGGLLRQWLFENGGLVVQPYGIQIVSFVQALSDLRGKVGGGKDEGITIPAAVASIYGPNILEFFQANIVPADTNAMIFARTPQEVLAIVYGGDASKPGGFFPSGLNGSVK
ncbi:Desiccation-related protein PCC13-62 [Coccomyxa sp. Obi]|nr:Desiccation-related protein PCC13-62 [Coccomyxa sp. Obi]